MAQSTMYDVRPGLWVFTASGDELGEVKEVRGGAFKVDAPWAMDFWIGPDDILSVMPGDRVTVHDDFERLGREERERRFSRRDRYTGGMDYDREDARWRRGPGYGPDFDYGDSFSWDASGSRAGGSRNRRPDDANSRRFDYQETSDDRFRFRPTSERSGAFERQSDERYEPSGTFLGSSRDRYAAQRGASGERYGESRDQDRPEWSALLVGRYQSLRESPSRSDRGDYRGMGPRGYQRSDERICEDACEALTHNPEVDATNIDVTVEGGEVRLQGTVETRYDKRLAEDVVSDVRGVRDVRNELKTQTGMAFGHDQD